jgi:hypothetical protein
VWDLVDRLKIKYFREQVEASRRNCEVLANQFAAAQTNREKKRITREYDEALKETHALQLLLERLERGLDSDKSRTVSRKVSQNTSRPGPPNESHS